MRRKKTQSGLRSGLMGAVLTGTLLVYGCATTDSVQPEDGPSVQTAEQDQSEIPDPLRPMNEVFFDLNQGLDEVILEPVTRGYEAVIPPFVQEGIHNVLHNLGEPKAFFSCVLQAEFEKALTVLGRIFVNSTFGLFGLVDVASEMGVEPINEDFGTAFKAWGVETGPYLVLPVIGATSFRDGVGLLMDTLTDPFNLVMYHNKKPELVYTRWGVDLVDWRLQYLDLYEKLQETSLDLYSTIRSLYNQKRGDGGGVSAADAVGEEISSQEEEPVDSGDIKT